jgi:rfaE bifunctional protein kinase chain/domain
VNQSRLNQILSTFPSRRIAVIGDFFLDKYLDFDPTLAEISLETNKTANQVVGIRRSPGAAGNVVSNLVALNAGSVIAVGFTGDDGEGYDLRQALESLGCDISNMLTSKYRFTPTYLKPQDISKPGLEGESGRFDTKNRTPLPKELEDSLLERLNAVISNIDAIIIVDQADEPNCGVITDRVRTRLCELGEIHKDIVFWTDSRHRAGLFSSITLKCNAKEALVAIGRPDEVQSVENLISAGTDLYNRTNRPVFLTRGEDGMIVFDSNAHEHVRGVNIDGPVDPTGAGDSATAGAVLSLASKATSTESALIANLVASITVQKLGQTGTASPSDVSNRLAIWNSQA